MKKIFLLFLLLIIPISVKADCDNDEIIRLQKIANNINTNYEYDDISNSFSITFTNVSNELIIEDINNKLDYYGDLEFTINNLSSNEYTYYVYAKDKNCYESELTIKNIQLPYYNQYYNYKECTGIENYEMCSKWLPKNINYDDWLKDVTEYRKSIKQDNKTIKHDSKKTIFGKIRDIIVDLYVTHYNIFLPIIILSLCAIIYLKNKSDQLI